MYLCMWRMYVFRYVCNVWNAKQCNVMYVCMCVRMCVCYVYIYVCLFWFVLFSAVMLFFVNVS